MTVSGTSSGGSPGSPSSTRGIPAVGSVPRHVAIIMDGNGRWATKRFLPRVAGHKRGVEAVREVVRSCGDLGIEYLTLFAFSSENWRRPQEEVSVLMQLFALALDQEVAKLHANNIRLRVIGDLTPFGEKLNALIRKAEAKTATNIRLTLTICANYGGRWDIMQATHRMLAERPHLATSFSEDDLSPYLAMAYAPEPDLFIRTGGEQRISNFLVWQLAYTELFFTDTFWPDFDARTMREAIASYQTRERRFGRTSEQVTEARRAVPPVPDLATTLGGTGTVGATNVAGTTTAAGATNAAGSVTATASATSTRADA